MVCVSAKSVCVVLACLLAPTAPVRADVLFSRPQSPAGGLIPSSWYPPDGLDSDVYAWDSFSLSGAAAVTEIQWQGDGLGNGLGFTITINPSVALPDQAVVLARYHVPGNAGQTPIGVVGGTQRYTYRHVLATPLQLAGATTYSINIEGTGGWSGSYATGGNGSHIQFIVGQAMFLLAPGDVAFTLIGTPACTHPSITTQPTPASACISGSSSVQFSVTAGGTAPLTYAWRRNAAPLDALANPSAATPTLTLSGILARDAGSYDCIVTNACGSDTSAPAALTVCVPDFDCSGAVAVPDIFLFLSTWFAGDARADINASGAVNVQDIFDFLAAWFTGC